MVTGLHFLLSYSCTYECDHCFVYSSPRAGGTFTMEQIRDALKEAAKTGSITTIFFEGGEPFLYYPLLLEAAREAKAAGFDVGIVTNGYFATTEEDAALWLTPLLKLGIVNLTVSDDVLHGGDKAETAAKRALRAAQKLGIPTGTISIDEPSVSHAPGSTESGTERGEPVVGGGVMFRGRAVEKLAAGLPVRNWEEFTECPHEKIDSPSRYHLDCYGNLQLCQGLAIGNTRTTPLAELIATYDAEAHPICRTLLREGPAGFVTEFSVPHERGYVDACHLCYHARSLLRATYPEYLAAPQVYGV